MDTTHNMSTTENLIEAIQAEQNEFNATLVTVYQVHNDRWFFVSDMTLAAAQALMVRCDFNSYVVTRGSEVIAESHPTPVIAEGNESTGN